MKLTDKIYIAGHSGMVGAALLRNLRSEGYTQLLTCTRAELNLCDAAAVDHYLAVAKPIIVIAAAAKVGGIHANNTYPADFIRDNLSIALNLIEAARRNAVRRLLFLGSSCIYPRLAPQPLKEESLLTASLEPTNEAYAIAKIAGLKLCQYYRRQYGLCYHSVMPCNLYGSGDNYHPQNSHVLAALIRSFHEAKEQKMPEVTLWGTGTPRREFLHVDDCAAGILHILKLEDPPDWVNLSAGDDIPICEAAEIVRDVVGFTGRISFDPSKPDGVPRKLMDPSLLGATIDWRPRFTLRSGIADAYTHFLREKASHCLREH